MRKFDFSIMKGGWFVGNFEPTAFKTKDCEVAYVKHFKDQEWEKHFHKIATEITFVIKGKIKINDTIFSSGDIFVIEPNEIADPKFLEDSEVIVVKLPSSTSDKYNIEK